MSTETTTPPPTLTTTGHTVADGCYRCGYDLRGIGDEQPCPECGLLARRSRHVSDELHDTRPRWLRRISRGANLILLSLLVVFTWPFASSLILNHFIGTAPGAPPAWVFLSQYVGMDLNALLLLAGVWLLTSPEGYAPADHDDRQLRFALRTCAFVPLVVVLGLNVQMYVQYRLGSAGQTRSWQGLISGAVSLLSTVGMAPLPFLLFMHLRGLARRARSAHLAEHCVIVGVGTAAAFVYADVISLLSEFADTLGLGSNWRTASNVSLWLSALASTAAILFTLWSLYLLVRFAIAFRRAARALRGKWRIDDRAARALAPAKNAS